MECDAGRLPVLWICRVRMRLTRREFTDETSCIRSLVLYCRVCLVVYSGVLVLVHHGWVVRCVDTPGHPVVGMLASAASHNRISARALGNVQFNNFFRVSRVYSYGRRNLAHWQTAGCSRKKKTEQTVS